VGSRNNLTNIVYIAIVARNLRSLEGVCKVIDRVGTVSVFVSDQDRAKDFYTNTLGFELRRDEPLAPGATARWVAVAPKG
jgi:hypothetical protein